MSASENAARSAVVGSKSCGSIAPEETTVVTFTQSPPRVRTSSLHWLTDTTTSTTSVGQAWAFPFETAGPLAALLEQAGRPSRVKVASAARTGMRTRGTAATLLRY